MDAGIHLEVAGSKLAFLARNHAPVEITPFTVDFAHRGNQVEQVVVGSVEYRINLLAALAARKRGAIFNAERE